VNTETEWRWIRRCLAGEGAAYEPLVRGHEARGLAVAEALLGDADEARDAVQEAFVRAYGALARLERGRPFGPWFAAILRNHCRDLLRSPRWRRRSGWDAERMDAVVWADPDAPARLESARRAVAVREALATLPPHQREVLVLKEMEGLSYAEIAEELDIAAGTVASRLHAARIAARSAIEAHGLAPEGAS